MLARVSFIMGASSFSLMSRSCIAHYLWWGRIPDISSPDHLTPGLPVPLPKGLRPWVATTPPPQQEARIPPGRPQACIPPRHSIRVGVSFPDLCCTWNW